MPNLALFSITLSSTAKMVCETMQIRCSESSYECVHFHFIVAPKHPTVLQLEDFPSKTKIQTTTAIRSNVHCYLYVIYNAVCILSSLLIKKSF